MQTWREQQAGRRLLRKTLEKLYDPTCMESYCYNINLVRHDAAGAANNSPLYSLYTALRGATSADPNWLDVRATLLTQQERDTLADSPQLLRRFHRDGRQRRHVLPPPPIFPHLNPLPCAVKSRDFECSYLHLMMCSLLPSSVSHDDAAHAGWYVVLFPCLSA